MAGRALRARQPTAGTAKASTVQNTDTQSSGRAGRSARSARPGKMSEPKASSGQESESPASQDASSDSYHEDSDNAQEEDGASSPSPSPSEHDSAGSSDHDKSDGSSDGSGAGDASTGSVKRRGKPTPKTTPTASSQAASASQARTYLEAPQDFVHSYPVTQNEVGVLTIEPYKAALLPHWRFKTPAIAQESAEALWARFREYGKQDDFVGMDMARKFIQMGMTRAKRYANYKGGRKYAPARSDGSGDVRGRDGKLRGHQLDKSTQHEGKDDKEQASLIFRGFWERCKVDQRYAQLKEEFLAERKRAKGKKG